MINYFQVIFLGLMQGVTELFPVSSLGHSVILPKLLGWHINQNDPFFLSFLVTTHVATATVLFLFFWKDWLQIISGIVRSLKEREIKPSDTYAKLGWLLIFGTIPAGILGLLFDEQLKTLFASATLAAVFLTINGILLFGAEYLRKRAHQKEIVEGGDKRVAKLSYKQASVVGILQALALFPGISRTGATISGSLLVGLSHEDSLRYSFLLATPIIAAAGLLKIPDLFSASEQKYIPYALVGALFAALAALYAVKFLTKYFKTNTLIPFAIYCLLMGLGSFAVLLFR